MEKALKIVAWIQVILGGLAIFSWLFEDDDPYALIGGALYLGAGLIALKYIKEVKKGIKISE